jgi:hypothetical protein
MFIYAKRGFVACTLPFRAMGEISDFKEQCVCVQLCFMFDDLRKIPLVSLKLYLIVLTQIAAMPLCSSFNRRVMTFAELGRMFRCCTRTLCRDPNEIYTLLCKPKTQGHLYSWRIYVFRSTFQFILFANGHYEWSASLNVSLKNFVNRTNAVFISVFSSKATGNISW